MKIVGAIITCLLLWYFRIWLVQHIFAKQQKKLSRKLFWTSLLLVVSLLFFEKIFNYYFPDLVLMRDQVVSLEWWGCFLLYCILIFVFLILINQNWKEKKIRLLSLIRLILLVVLAIFGLEIWLSATALSCFVLAYAEEFLKIWATENRANKSDFYSSDLLFLSIFIALWFSIIENFFYIWKDIFGSDTEWILSLAFWRGIFASLLHFIATWLIALLLYKLYQQQHLKFLSNIQKIWRVIVALLVWVIVHRWYNLSVERSNLLIYIILVFGWYFLLTYLLFLSDKLYIDKKSD